MTENFVNTQMKAFLGVLLEANMRVGIYASQWVFEDLIDWNWIKENNVEVWNAHYGGGNDINATIHQYSESEYIRGIGPFDANIRYA